VTIIEVGLILSITASGGPQTATLARDTVFAAVMITCNGIVGLSLLVGAVRRHVVEFQAAGSGGAFAQQRHGARRRGAPRDLRGVPVVAVIP
jgi:Ca2+:H+ antiporter